MKHRLLAIVSTSVVLLGGCAGMRASEEGGKSPTTKAQTPKPLTAKDIVDRYARLIYGQDGKRNHSSTTLKGTLSIEQFNIDGPVVIYAMAPDSNVSNIAVMGQTLSSGCHKNACWSQQPGTGPTPLSGGAAAMQLQQADYHQWSHMDRYYTSMEILPPADGTEKPNYEIKAVKPTGLVDRFYFEKASGLLVGAVYDGETPQGRMEVTIRLKDYRNFEGEMIPMQLVQSFAQATLTLTFTEVSHAPIAEEKFAMPK